MLTNLRQEVLESPLAGSYDVLGCLAEFKISNDQWSMLRSLLSKPVNNLYVMSLTVSGSAVITRSSTLLSVVGSLM
jgi:hypothetical protein